jgi:hypothetical protein
MNIYKTCVPLKGRKTDGQNAKKIDPIEFFMNVMAIEMVAPGYGKHTLKEYFNGLEN